MLLRLIVMATVSFPAGLQAASLPSVAFGTDRNGTTTFSTPSSNIECVFIPRGGSRVSSTRDGLAELTCDRAQPSYVRIVMGVRGRVTVIRNPGEQPCCTTDNPLPHGSIWQGDVFRCESAAVGLTCERPDGHGFLLSRASAKVH